MFSHKVKQKVYYDLSTSGFVKTGLCKLKDGGEDRKPAGGASEEESPKFGTPHVHGLPAAIPQTPDECDVSIQGKCILGTDDTDEVGGELDNGDLDSGIETGRWSDSSPCLYIGELVSNPGTGRNGELVSSPTNGRWMGLLILCKRSKRGCKWLGNGVNAELPDDWNPWRPIPGYDIAAGFGNPYG